MVLVSCHSVASCCVLLLCHDVLLRVAVLYYNVLLMGCDCLY